MAASKNGKLSNLNKLLVVLAFGVVTFVGYLAINPQVFAAELADCQPRAVTGEANTYAYSACKGRNVSYEKRILQAFVAQGNNKVAEELNNERLYDQLLDQLQDRAEHVYGERLQTLSIDALSATESEIRFSVRQHSGQDLASQTLANTLGTGIVVTYVQPDTPLSVNGMYGDPSPFIAGAYSTMKFKNRYGYIGKGGSCTSGIPYDSATWNATIVTAGHCVVPADYDGGVRYYQWWTRYKNGDLRTRVGGSIQETLRNSDRSSIRGPDGTYNGDAGMIRVLDGKKIAGTRAKRADLAVGITGYESGKNAGLKNNKIELCWTGAASGKTLCGFRVVERNVSVNYDNAGAVRPLQHMRRYDYAVCTKSGDSGGPVYRRDNGKIVGIISGSKDIVGFPTCHIYYTAYADIQQAFAGYGLTNGDRRTN